MRAILFCQNCIGVRVWSKQRCHEWWKRVESGLFREDWWRENLRMSHDTFKIICDQLRPYIQRHDTIFRKAVSVEARVAVTIWRLASNVEYRTIAGLFGLGRSTVCEIVLDTCEMIAKYLMPKYVRIPQGDSLQEVVRGFEDRWGFPQTVGAIDGSHIPILKPIKSASDYYNRKGYYSILMQAVVDFRGIFIDVNIGWPGKVHDARVFVNSSFYQKVQNGTLLPNWSHQINGVAVPLLILGDPAYPLLPWLMKPYIETVHSTNKQRNFNYRQSRARMVVENAFGRLKGRWRCLLKRIDSNLDNVPNIISSCVVLHNICEIFGDSCSQEWFVGTESVGVPSTSAAPSTTSSTASHIRDAICDYLA